jgi:hypothetical protein
MKTIFTLSLLPVIVLAYFFGEQLYVAGNYVAAYALVATSFVATVICIYQVGSILERQRA